MATLPNKVPFVRLFTATGEDLHPKVIRFSYRYSEESDDVMTCQLEVSSVEELDKPYYQEDAKLQVIWGYVNGAVSKQRTVFIRDLKPSISSTKGITLHITATDKLSYSKSNHTQNKKPVENQTLKTWVTDIVKRYRLNLFRSPTDAKYPDTGVRVPFKNPEKKNLADKFINRNWLSFTESNANTSDTELYAGEKSFNFGVPHPEFTGDLSLISNEYDRQLFEAYLTGASNDFDELQRLVLMAEPDAIIEGRDEDVIIRQRNFAQPPWKIFSLTEDSGVIEYSPEVNGRANEAAAREIRVGSFDKENKTYVQQSFTEEEDNSSWLGDIAQGAVKSDSALTTVTIDGEGNISGSGIPTYKDGSKLNLFHSDVYIVEDPADPTKPTTVKIIGKNKQPRDIQTVGGLFEPEGPGVILPNPEFFTEELPIATLSLRQIQDSYLDPVQDSETLQTLIKNKRKKALLDLYTATLVVEGEPEFENGVVVNIQGAGKRYSGNNYVKEVEHTITSDGGYTTEAALVRNALGKTELNGPAMVTAEQAGKPKNTEGTEVSDVKTMQFQETKDPTKP